MVFMSGSWLSLDICMFGSVSSFHVSSHLMFHDCVLIVSPTDTAKCLFCVETLACLAESSPGQFSRRLLTYCKTVVLVVAVFSWI